jgi:P4 family phage/plasmid primase-like protien
MDDYELESFLDNEPLRDVEDQFDEIDDHIPDLEYDQDDPLDNEPELDVEKLNMPQQTNETLKDCKIDEPVSDIDECDEDQSDSERDQPLLSALVPRHRDKSQIKHKPLGVDLCPEFSGSRNDPPSQPVKLKPGNAYELAQELMRRVNFIIVCSAIYMFNGIVYELLDNETLDRLILKELREPIAEIGRPEIISAIRAFVKKEPKLVIDDPTIDPNFIVFRNGRLDIRTMEFADNDPLVFQTSYLNFNYDRYNTHCPNFEKYLESVSGGDPDIKELMLQTHGYIASCSMDAKSFFLFIGEGDTGKSLTLGLDTMFFPNDFVSTIELQALGDKFSTGNLANVRLNVGGDLPNKPLTPDVVKHVKGITGNDMMTAEKKFVQPFSFKPTCKFVFATNHPLVLQQRDDQFCERLVVIPFDNKIPKDRQDHDLLNKLRDELPAIFNMILEAFLRLRNNNFEFKKVVNLSNYVAIPLSESGSVSHLEEAVDDFVSIHYEITGDSGDFVSIKQLYAEFNAYYLQHYNLNTNQDKFSKAFRQLFDKSETNGYPRKYQSNAHGRGYQGIRRKD